MNVPGRWRPPTLFLLQSEGLDDLWHFSLLLLIVMIGFIMLGTAQFAGARRREFLKSYAKFSKVVRIMLGTAHCAGSRRREILKSTLNRAFCIAPLYSTCPRPLTFENFCHWLLRISATLRPMFFLYPIWVLFFCQCSAPRNLLATAVSLRLNSRLLKYCGKCSSAACLRYTFSICICIYTHIYIHIYILYILYILYLILVTYNDNMH